MNVRATLAAALLVASTVPALTAGTAHAQSDGEVIRRGSCTGSTDWKIKAKPDDNRIEVEAEIDSNRNGQSWKWVLKHNGSVSARGTSKTRPPSGSFEVSRRTVDAAGTDGFKFRAKNRASGEVCVARVRL